MHSLRQLLATLLAVGPLLAATSLYSAALGSAPQWLPADEAWLMSSIAPGVAGALLGSVRRLEGYRSGDPYTISFPFIARPLSDRLRGTQPPLPPGCGHGPYFTELGGVELYRLLPRVGNEFSDPLIGSAEAKLWKKGCPTSATMLLTLRVGWSFREPLVTVTSYREIGRAVVPSQR